MKIITLSGFQKGNRISSMGEYNVYVPAEHYGMVESIHILILQQIADAILCVTANAFREDELKRCGEEMAGRAINIDMAGSWHEDKKKC